MHAQAWWSTGDLLRKGDVRRAMQKAGFSVERMPGPPGKREMLRATRLDVPAGRFNVRVYMIVTRMSPSTGQEQALLSFERLAMEGDEISWWWT